MDTARSSPSDKTSPSRSQHRMRKEKVLLAATTMPTVQPTIRPGRQMGNYGKILLPPGNASVTLDIEFQTQKSPQPFTGCGLTILPSTHILCIKSNLSVALLLPSRLKQNPFFPPLGSKRSTGHSGESLTKVGLESHHESTSHLEIGRLELDGR